MSKQTLTLAKKPATEPAIASVKEAPEGAIHAAREITAADVMEWLVKNAWQNGLIDSARQLEAAQLQQAAQRGAEELGRQQPGSGFDWKYDAPVESKPFDPATIPAHARTIPVQAPPKVWGNPRLVPSN